MRKAASSPPRRGDVARRTEGGVRAVIRASEIGQYAYCHRAWWLGSVLGYPSTNQAALRAGGRAHARHGRTVAASLRWRQLGYVFLAAGGLLLVLAVVHLLGAAL
jgi:hypothetical protein